LSGNFRALSKEIFSSHGKIVNEYVLDNHFYALNKSNDKLHELVYILI